MSNIGVMVKSTQTEKYLTWEFQNSLFVSLNLEKISRINLKKSIFTIF